MVISLFSFLHTNSNFTPIILLLALIDFPIQRRNKDENKSLKIVTTLIWGTVGILIRIDLKVLHILSDTFITLLYIFLLYTVIAIFILNLIDLWLYGSGLRDVLMGRFKRCYFIVE
jgi:hypothetical protein